MSASQPVLRRDGDGVTEVVLSRPRARNALNLRMCEELRHTFEALDSDRGTRVVLLKAIGDTFCAGADLKERVGKDSTWVRRRRLAAFAAYEAIERCSKPVVALVSGAVIGSGGEIAMSCDFVVAAESTIFRFPEPQWGTIGATQRLQRVIGKRRAKELLFTNRAMQADEAEHVGLVARVVPDGALERTGDELVATIAAAPALAIELTKQAVDLGSETDQARGIRIELAAIERCLDGDGWREGIAEFNAADRGALGGLS